LHAPLGSSPVQHHLLLLLLLLLLLEAQGL
jgi:hypothetical protein